VRAGRAARRPPAPPLLRVDGLCKAYADGAARAPILRGVDLAVRGGQIASLMGASGTGKSTLVSLLAGLMRPDAGRIELDGRDLGGLGDTERARLRARRIGVVLQSGNLIPFLTAHENVSLAIEVAGGRRPEARARELLLQLGLADRMNHLPRRMSGGEAQRVALATALANEPDLLLADEPTGELDSAGAERVMGVILQAWRERGLTVLLVTHDAALAQLAQVRVRLADGRLHQW
jgi:putative ABC transport system ATP-binding protein